MTPVATYRVQLHPGFTFADAAAVADYLTELGVSHLYCSPIFQAAPGSTHGYDVVDPQSLNRELGGAPAHAHLTGVLREAGLGQVLDIVPNHMAVDPANPWWWDVLENGPSSRSARVFDIAWEGDDERSATTVLVPILGDQYGRVLEAGELTLERDGAAFRLHYHEHVLPVAPRSLEDVLGPAARRCGSAELAAIADGFGALPHAARTDTAGVRERRTRMDELVQSLAALCETPTVAAAIDAELRSIETDPDRLDDLLQRQNYRVAHWRTASEELDYRRFFNIDTLIGVRVEDPDVFAATHELILDGARRHGRRAADRPRGRAPGPGGLPPPARRGDRRVLDRGREDPRAERVVAEPVAGGRHVGVRLPDPGERPLRRSCQRGSDDRWLPRVHRRVDRLPGAGPHREAPDPGGGAGDRGRPPDRSARHRVRASPPPPGPHPP